MLSLFSLCHLRGLETCADHSARARACAIVFLARDLLLGQGKAGRAENVNALTGHQTKPGNRLVRGILIGDVVLTLPCSEIHEIES